MPKGRSRLPSGFSPGHSARAIASFTKIAGGAAGPSVSAGARPAVIRIPIASKNPGLVRRYTA
jgi:hypothetical protein